MNSNSSKKLETEILNFIDRFELLSAGDKILLALSGGPDSVFGLNFFSKYKQRLKIDLVCIHVNHMLRDNESDDDEAFVKRICDESGIELVTVKRDVRKYAEKNKYSIEEAARNIRYSEFVDVMKKTNCNKIVTAHNNNDNTETVLLNTIRGTGLSGFSGIPVERDSIIRPFLIVTKNSIIDYLEDNKIEYRKDSSNYSEDFQRNYLRINIVPEIENNLNPSVHKSILNTSLNLQSALQYLNKNIDDAVSRSISVEDDNIELLLTYPELGNDYLFGEVLKRLCGNHLQIEFNRIMLDQIHFLRKRQTGRSLALENGWRAIRERDKIIFTRISDTSGEAEYILKAGGSIEIDGMNIGCDYVDVNSEELSKDVRTEIISADKLDDIFILRKWKIGDKFHPLGMKGTKKISDFLTEQKVPAHNKQDFLVLANNETIIWVVGLRISEKVKLSKTTKKAIKLWMK